MPDGMNNALLFAVAIGLYFLINNYIKNRRERISKELIAWCVTDNSDIYRCNLNLDSYIHNAQIQCNVPAKYRIEGDDEWHYVKAVLDVFQKHLVQSYFCGKSFYKKSTYVIPGSDFFMFQLFCFLSEHHCDSRILGHELYAKQISHQDHGMWGDHLYDAVYEFSDFGRTVQKLYYITFLACKASTIYKDDIAGWLTPEYFTEDLDTNQIHISSR